MRPEGSKEEILAEFESGLSDAERRVCAIDFAAWSEPREVGRRKLPTTVAGLLIHCAEHTQRHVGQAITTAKVLLELREPPSSLRIYGVCFLGDVAHLVAFDLQIFLEAFLGFDHGR